MRQGPGPRFCAAAAAVLGTLGLPAIATASTVHSPESGITLTANPGERNFLFVVPSGGGMLRLHDDLADLTAGFACTQVDPRTVDCPPRGQPATFELGDDRDELRVGTGTAIPVVARGGDGNDAIIAFGAGPSNLDGGGGNDFLAGGLAADTLSGGPGQDLLRGDASDANGTVSTTSGGDDLLRGGPDTDSYDGGAGLDTVSYADATSAVTAVLPRPPEEGGVAPGQGGEGEGLPPDVEGVIGGPGADNLTGNNAGNRLEGGPGRDTLTGGKGSDLLAGGDGGDSIFARDAIADLISCGTNGSGRLARSDTLDSDLADGRPPVDCETVTQGALLEGANVRMRGGLLRADGDGRVAVRLACPRRVAIGCVGRLVLRLQQGRGSGPRSQATARSRRYRIRRGRSKAVSLRLSRRERAALRRAARFARLTSIEAGQLGRKTTIRTVRLRRTS